jgi:uncharacterized membrane protein HdeD (DUF308 family)
MTSDTASSLYRHTWWSLVLRGLIALALGIFILARPLDSVAAFALVIAIWALVAGLTQIVYAIELRSAARHWWMLLLSGLVSLGFGVAALVYYPVLSLTFAVIWVAWWLFAVGILGILIGLQERRIGIPWGWTAALGVLGVAAGIYAFIAAPVTLVAIMSLIAAFAILGGVMLLFGAFRLSQAHRALGHTSGSAAHG